MTDRVRERGSGTVEYVGIVVVVALLVTAVATALVRFDLGETLACEMRRVVDQSGSCGTGADPTYYGGQGGGGGDTVSVAAPREDPQDGGDEDSDDGATTDAEPERFAHDGREDRDADEEAVAEALGALRDALSGGFFGVRSGDLDDAMDAVTGLDGPELDALVAGLSDAELERWVSQLEDGWLFGGWDRERRRDLWELFAREASKHTLDRLAGFTDELQPAFDEVGGDDARDSPESPANSGEYGEIPHELYVGTISPRDVTQGQIGDCWYIAGIMAVAQSDSSLIRDAIVANDNGTYSVTLYDDGVPVTITVTPEMVLDEGNPAFVRNRPKDGAYEMWPMVLEKALALHWGDYSEIEGNSPGLGLEILTGRPSERRRMSDAGGLDALAGYLEDGGAISLASFTASDDNPPLYDVSAGEGGLVNNHAYYVSSVDTEAGTVTVTNPWGSNWPTVTMTYAEFEASFSSVYFNEVS